MGKIRSGVEYKKRSEKSEACREKGDPRAVDFFAQQKEGSQG